MRSGTKVIVPNPVVFDICDASPVITSDAPAVFPLGTTLVTFTVTDASGNSTVVTTTVTVVDTTKPILWDIPRPIIVEQRTHDGTPVPVIPPCCSGTSSSLPRSFGLVPGTIYLTLPRVYDICDAAPVLTHNAPAVFPLGTTVVLFTATDFSGNVSYASTTVTVVDRTAPSITAISATPNVLSPIDHRMVPVTILVTASDLCDSAPVARIISVSSSDPLFGTGPGDLAPDWQITGPLTINLRAEAAPWKLPNGRVYTITVKCTDFSGNASTRTVKVTAKPAVY